MSKRYFKLTIQTDDFELTAFDTPTGREKLAYEISHILPGLMHNMGHWDGYNVKYNVAVATFDKLVNWFQRYGLLGRKEV